MNMMDNKSSDYDKKKVVYGIFKSRSEVERAVDRLKTEGFSNTDISVLMPDSGDTKEFAHEKATKAPEGTTAGATTGVAAGGILGWLVGAGALAIPGLGPFVAAGPIMGALAGAGAGGAVGGLTGGLIGMGFPEYEAKRYAGYVKDGGMLLSVHCEDSEEVDRAKELLEAVGAEDISSSSAARGADRSDVSSSRTERPGPYSI